MLIIMEAQFFLEPLIKKVEFIIENIDGDNCFIESKTIDKKFEFKFASLEKSDEHWHNYILGTVNYLINKKNQKNFCFFL